MGLREFTGARDLLLATHDAPGLSSADVCAEIVRAFHRVLRFGWCAVMTTDPSTLLPSGGVVDGFAREDCVPFWDNELLDPDVLKFADLARGRDPVASLDEALDGDLARSPRYRKLYAELGAADEVRVAFVAGSSCLAIGDFVRRGDDGPVDAQELADVRALVPVATTALRRALGRTLAEVELQTPVVVMLDGSGTVTGVSAGGRQVLADLRIDHVDGELPGIIQAAVIKARDDHGGSGLTTRVRGRSGRWLRLHVSSMEGGSGAVALTVETARPDDLARVLLDSYGLTSRETEIVLRLCRGLAAKEIGADLIISVHTVRDHIKAIYDKAGVNSRGELVAQLFSNHVLDHFHDTVEHVPRTGGRPHGHDTAGATPVG